MDSGGSSYGGEADSKPMDEGSKDSGKTYLLNKDISPDSKPGEELIVKVLRVLENELEVAYSPEPDKKGSGDKSGEYAKDDESSMDSMFA